jgi:hypothetical protein
VENNSGNSGMKYILQIEWKGFWWWCMTLRMAGFLDFVCHPEF